MEIEDFKDLLLPFGLLIVFIIGSIIIKRQNSVKKSLQFRLVFYGVVMIILWFSLPMTPSLSTFGYPEDIADIESKEKLLKYLQRYNVAIVKTTEVVHWMIFITVFWLLSIVSTLIKHVKLEDSAK
ncbi:hypothetical protein [Flavobacterium pallidum]|nr:hypothetical protein [Flavobacterium pallidum]